MVYYSNGDPKNWVSAGRLKELPLTKRQFELGVYDETESLMYLVYELLSRNKHLAYSEGELLEMYKGNRESRVDQLRRALEELTGMGAVESRKIDGTLYYAFRREVDPTTWEPR